MAKCKLCGKHGLFVFVDKDGYCPDCAKWKKEKDIREAERYKQEKQAQEQRWALINSIPEFEIVWTEKPCKRQSGFEGRVFSNITPKGQYQDIVVFDTETTGLAPSSDRIVEIAAIRYIDKKPVGRFHSYINPERPIPPEASKKNGITDDMVAVAPVIGRVIKAFDEFVGTSTLVAHNLEFDLKFVYYSGSQLLNQKRQYIDTLAQARKIVKKDDVVDYTLDSLCSYYRITNARWHSAMADADAAGQLFFALVDDKQSE